MSFCVWMRDSTTTVDPSGASSRTSVDWYWPAPRKDNGTWIVLAPGPHIAARNHVLPFRRANSTSSPISDPVSTRVSSHVDGMLLMTSTAGLARMLSGLAAMVSNGLANTARLAIWCATLESRRRSVKSIVV